MLLFQAIIAVGLTTCLVNLVLNLLTLKTPRRGAKVPSPAPKISVMIPARNEAANIRACLASLLRQDYPDFEILVLDDNSGDDTAAIVTEMAAADSRIRLFSGLPLPDDWAGKPFACHQLSRRATGEWFLFVDADTTHEPHMLRSTLELAIRNGTSLLSGFPRQLATSLPQKIALPMMYYVILSWVPLWWLHAARTPQPSLAIGQFMLLPRDDYLKIGGHRAVKARIIEDVWLGIEITRAGGRHLAVNLAPVVSCLMYRDLGAMWEGFLKWCYSVAYLSPAGLGALIVAGVLLFLGPFFWLRDIIVSLPVHAAWQWYVVLQVVVIYLTRLLIDARVREPLLPVILHPLGMAYLVAAAVTASLRRLVGAGVHWKDREYGRESVVR
jgi:chlorobactene glucosyltransferase